jgi:AmmeMemoRadiSam system protein B
VIRCLDPAVETIVVAGGHDPPGGPLIAYRDDGWRTPGGILERDVELGQWMDRNMDAVEEMGADNTVEVMMPLIRAVRPDVRWLAWRVPADVRALEFGSQLYEGSLAVGRKVAVLGSTDLTHYGPNYGFTPPESREYPSHWAEKRDRRFIEALTAMDGAEILRLAEKDSTACSAGGAAAAMAYASASGSKNGTLLDYTTSLEKHPGSSFVGYGAVVYPAA